MVPSISDLHKALNTRELRQIRIKIKHEAQELKKLMADELEEDELVDDEDGVDILEEENNPT